MELENSMLRPCIHNEKEDGIRIDEATWVYPEELEDEEEQEDCKYHKGDIVTDGEIKMVVTKVLWKELNDDWLYECEPIEESEYWYMEMYESQLSPA